MHSCLRDRSLVFILYIVYSIDVDRSEGLIVY
jgi:hypothetical protein